MLWVLLAILFVVPLVLFYLLAGLVRRLLLAIKEFANGLQHAV